MHYISKSLSPTLLIAEYYCIFVCGNTCLCEWNTHVCH